MINFLRKIFIKNYDDIENQEVRVKHGNLASMVGIFSNLLLFVMKIVIGFIAGSMAIIGDSFNNLNDMGSSAITFFGFKLSNRPADKLHPYGHERFEYISGLIVSIIIIVISIQLFIESISQFITGLTHYEPENFSIVIFIILGISILIKLWQGLFNRKIGKIIDSVSLAATAQDSFNDAISTTAILAASIISFIFPKIMIFGYYISLDNLMGVIVAIMIFISGVQMIKETINPLLGTAPSKEFIRDIVTEVKTYQGVLGVHDVICHTYGPTKRFISLHVEVDSRNNIMESHELIDNIEKDIHDKFQVEVVIHMDPVDTVSLEIKEYRKLVNEIISKISDKLSIHDFRIVNGPKRTNLIFDCLVPFDIEYTHDEIKNKIQTELNKLEKEVKAVINFDIDYNNIYNERKK